MLVFKVRGQEQLRKLSADLQSTDEWLREEVRTALRNANVPTVRALKHAFRLAKIRGRRTKSKRRFTAQMPSGHPRAWLASAISADVHTSGGSPAALIQLDETQVPGPLQPLIPYFAGKKRLRHPIMGNREAWAGQTIEDVWWPTIREHLGDYRREIDAAVGRVADKLERG